MEAREEKEAQVAAWLKKIFGDHPIPQYEVNPRTTEILYHLSERNKVRDRDVHLVIEDLKQKASEYESEGESKSRIMNEIIEVTKFFITRKYS
uniref:HAUS augmin-like complex subunit 1 n=1 Tax=Urocitellus parryii TaxID=9999 RepID=A0A8D2HHC6_UROPR